MNEIFGGIKVIKLYAWEPSFIKIIKEYRQQEIKNLKSQAYLSAGITFAFNSAPFFVAIASFATYIFVNPSNVLNAQKAFVSLTIFNILRRPLAFFPQLITSTMMFIVSVKRITNYLNSEDIDDDIKYTNINVNNNTMNNEQQCASTVKRVHLELGGNAPFIVFESANVDDAVDGLIQGKFRNAGQTCVCPNRVFVHHKLYDEFINKLIEKMKEQLIIGDGMNEQTTIGPLINKNAKVKVKQHIDDALVNGAKVIYGGKELNNNFVEPTIIKNVNSNCLCFNEETFGPVIPIIKFTSDDEVLSQANAVRSGLAGYFYSNDLKQINYVAKQLQVGMVGINEGIMSCCEGPFGGVKESGLGREGSHFGCEEFTEVKYICMGSLTSS